MQYSNAVYANSLDKIFTYAGVNEWKVVLDTFNMATITSLQWSTVGGMLQQPAYPTQSPNQVSIIIRETGIYSIQLSLDIKALDHIVDNLDTVTYIILTPGDGRVFNDTVASTSLARAKSSDFPTPVRTENLSATMWLHAGDELHVSLDVTEQSGTASVVGGSFRVSRIY